MISTVFKSTWTQIRLEKALATPYQHNSLFQTCLSSWTWLSESAELLIILGFNWSHKFASAWDLLSSYQKDHFRLGSPESDRLWDCITQSLPRTASASHSASSAGCSCYIKVSDVSHCPPTGKLERKCTILHKVLQTFKFRGGSNVLDSSSPWWEEEPDKISKTSWGVL